MNRFLSMLFGEIGGHFTGNAYLKKGRSPSLDKSPNPYYTIPSPQVRNQTK